MAAALLGGQEHDGRLAASGLKSIDTSVRFVPRMDPCLFVVTASLPTPAHITSQQAADRAKRLHEILLAAVNSLLAQPPSPEEWAAARQNVLGHFQYDLETDSGLARSVGYAATVGGEPPEIQRERIKKLSPQDLRDFLQRYLNPDHHLTVQLLPADATTQKQP